MQRRSFLGSLVALVVGWFGVKQTEAATFDFSGSSRTVAYSEGRVRDIREIPCTCEWQSSSALAADGVTVEMKTSGYITCHPKRDFTQFFPFQVRRGYLRRSSSLKISSDGTRIDFELIDSPVECVGLNYVMDFSKE